MYPKVTEFKRNLQHFVTTTHELACRIGDIYRVLCGLRAHQNLLSMDHEDRHCNPVQSGLPAAKVAGKVTASPMPLTVFDCKGISATRRERIEAAVEAAGQHLAQPYEGWIAADPFRGGVRVLITGPQGFERTVTFALDEAPATITQRVKETIDD
jgi:hypothetical protein